MKESRKSVIAAYATLYAVIVEIGIGIVTVVLSVYEIVLYGISFFTDGNF
ncbi:MAG: hypothetical protein ACFB15_14185 [Cyclobacteriaceae bacterium]